MTALTLKSRHLVSFLITFVLGVLSFSGVAIAATSLEPASLEAGYRQMYNLDFDAAHQTFTAWEHAHPEDPLGPVSNAAAYLFAEFDRMHILESELFIDNARFEHRKSFAPDVKVRNAFENELQRGEQAANRALERSPGDHSAIFAKVMVGGLRGDYLALVEKRNLLPSPLSRIPGRSPRNCYRKILRITTPISRLALRITCSASIRLRFAGFSA